MAELNKPNFTFAWASEGASIKPSDEKIRQGWSVEIPPHQYENYVQNRSDLAIQYIYQKGIPEWDSTTEYWAGRSFTVGADGNLYRSLSNNVGSDPVDTEGVEWEDILSNLVPAGTVSAYAGENPPRGYLFCHGQSVSRLEYKRLFAAIGTIYGSGDGSTTFTLPDLRGEYIRGLDSGRGIDVDRVLGSHASDTLRRHSHSATSGGAGGHTHVASSSESGEHSHGASTGASGSHSHTASTGASGVHSHNVSISNSGSHAHDLDIAGGGAHSHSGDTESSGLHSHGSGTLVANNGGNHTHTGTANNAGNHNHSGVIGSGGNHRHEIRTSNWQTHGGSGGMGYSSQERRWGYTEYSGEHTHSLTVYNGGAHTHTLNINNGGAHSHTIGGNTASSGSHTHTFTTSVGGSHTHTGEVKSGGLHSHTAVVSNSGAHTHTVSIEDSGSHSHSVSVANSGLHTHNISVESVGNHTHSVTIGNTGEGETSPRSVALNYMIKY